MNLRAPLVVIVVAAGLGLMVSSASRAATRPFGPRGIYVLHAQGFEENDAPSPGSGDGGQLGIAGVIRFDGRGHATGGRLTITGAYRNGQMAACSGSLAPSEYHVDRLGMGTLSLVFARGSSCSGSMLFDWVREGDTRWLRARLLLRGLNNLAMGPQTVGAAMLQGEIVSRQYDAY